MRVMHVDAHLFLLAARFVCPEKKNLPHISGVYIHPGKVVGEASSSRIVATDGHRLIVFEDDFASPDRFPIVIRPEKGLLTSCKHERFYTKHLEVSEDGTVDVRVASGQTIYRSPGSLKMDVDFPPYLQVIPEKLENFVPTEDYPTLRIGLDCYYIHDFGLDEGSVELSISGCLDSIVVTNRAYPNMLGILMPQRATNHPLDLDEWRDTKYPPVKKEEE